MRCRTMGQRCGDLSSESVDGGLRRWQPGPVCWVQKAAKEVEPWSAARRARWWHPQTLRRKRSAEAYDIKQTSLVRCLGERGRGVRPAGLGMRRHGLATDRHLSRATDTNLSRHT